MGMTHMDNCILTAVIPNPIMKIHTVVMRKSMTGLLIRSLDIHIMVLIFTADILTMVLIHTEDFLTMVLILMVDIPTESATALRDLMVHHIIILELMKNIIMMNHVLSTSNPLV